MPKSLATINTVLWDLDGTLIDSEYIHEEAVIHACKELNLTLDIKTLAPGQDGITVFEHIIGEPITSKTLALFNKWYTIAIGYTVEHFYKARQIPQSIELVNEFAKLGIEQSIVSNTTNEIIQKCAKRLGINPFISNFIGRDNVSRGKPAPDPYLHALELHKQKAEHCIVFEDSYTGVQAAIGAGIRVIGVGDRTRDFPVTLNHICSFHEKSWLSEIKNKFL